MQRDTPRMNSSIGNAEERILDQWSFLDYKSSGIGQGPITPPLWTGDHTRRLRAYSILDAYYRNSARHWMNDELEQDEKEDRREYGDPYIIVESILSSLLGNDTRIAVTGAIADDASDTLKGLQKDMESWAKKEKIKLKFKECERNSVKLGDGVYVLGWNEDKKRCVVHVYDPGMYFPAFSGRESEEEFASTVHIAYEYEEWNASKQEKELFLRRMTWKLLPVDEKFDADNSVSPPDTAPAPKVPWDTTAKQNCWFEDKTWLLDVVDTTIDDPISKTPKFSEEKWLDIDYIPILHVPTTYSAGHYGVSCLSPVFQVFDDLVSNDTDLQKASAVVASPIIGVGGQAPKDEDGNVESFGPGTVYDNLEGTSGLQMLDTSRSLDALLKYDEALTGKLSRNARVPKTLLGDVDPSKVPSGVVLTLSFAPHSSMIREMREIRDDKYSLLLKMVHRFHWKFGDWKWTDKDEPEIKLLMGSYLPADRQEISGIVTNMSNAKAMSTETKVALMIEAGFPIEDAVEEVRRIIQNDWDEAGKMLDATGDAAAVRKRMGLEGQGPALPVPPAPNGSGAGNVGPPPAPVSNLG